MAVTISSCGDRKEAKTTMRSTEEIIQQLDTVNAIGKVTAANGTAIIASATTGMIKDIQVKEGDTVAEGALLINLSNQLGAINIATAKTKLTAINGEKQITTKDIEREQISLSFLEQKYKTSKTLYEKQAETKENYLNDESNYLQQQERIASLKKQQQINLSQAQEQQLNIDKEKITSNNYNITAPRAGVIINLYVQVGQNVNNNESLGEIIDTENIIIEAEVDEMFADKIAVGQDVSFVNISTKQLLGKGKIIYSAPILMNKSILFETANEADDRRVLRVKIKPNSPKHLLINAKVECQIKIR